MRESIEAGKTLPAHPSAFAAGPVAWLMAIVLAFAFPVSAFAEGTASTPDTSAAAVATSGSETASTDSAASDKTIVVGYTDYAGFVEEKEPGKFSGYGVDFITRLAKECGLTVTFKQYQWTDLVGTVDADGNRTGSALLDGSVDIVLQAQRTSERERDFSFTDYPTGYESTIAYTLGDNEDIYFNDYQGMEGKRVALLSNSYQTEEFINFAEGKFSFIPQYYDTDSQMYDALQKKEVDVLVNGSLSSFSDLKTVERIGAAPYFCMASPANADLIDQLNSAFGDLIGTEPGFTANLYSKYYSTSSYNSTPLFTREEVEYIASAGTITLGQHRLRKPVSELNDDGSMTGINEDIMNEISRLSGLNFEYVAAPVDITPAEALRAGDFDLMCGMSQTNNFINDSTLTTSNVFLSANIVPLVKRGTDYNPSDQLTIAVPKRFQALNDLITDSYPNFTIKTFLTNEECLQAVADGDVDVTMQNEYLLNYMLQSPRYSNLEVVRAYFFTEDSIVVGLSDTTDPLLMSVINKSISCLSEETLNQIVVSESAANYYEYTWDDTFYQYGTQILLAVFAVLAILALGAGVIFTRQRMVTSLESKNEELAKATKMAQSASSAKGDFLAQMSHEIRTPMNAIIGMTALAEEDVNDPQRVHEDLTKIDASSKMLLSLINDILDMTAIENGKMKIASAEFDFKQLLSGISTVFYLQSKQKSIDFSLHLIGDVDEYLVGDQLRVNQILLNLLSNAVKFTKPGGHIRLSVAETERTDVTLSLTFTVADDGVGMTEDMKERLFLPFEQENASTARKHGGSGLGMSITKNLVDLMHGTISVESAKDEGTTFVIQLPFGVSDRTSQPIPPEAVSALRVLVVDDDEDTLTYESSVLDRLRVSYDVADKGETALELLGDAEDEGHPFDVVLLDWKMPDMDGLQVTREIRSVFGSESTIIIASAYDTSEIEDEAREAGADFFISKPLFQSTLFDALARASRGDFVIDTADKKTYDFKGRTVLLAEDVAMNMEVAVRLLKAVNISVMCAEDGQQAAMMFEKSAPGSIDAILMDVNMPNVDGYEATQLIRKSGHADAKTIPIYAMTANAFTEDVTAALNAGMDGHLAKPIDTQLLYETLKNAFGVNDE